MTGVFKQVWLYASTNIGRKHITGPDAILGRHIHTEEEPFLRHAGHFAWLPAVYTGPETLVERLHVNGQGVAQFHPSVTSAPVYGGDCILVFCERENCVMMAQERQMLCRVQEGMAFRCPMKRTWRFFQGILAVLSPEGSPEELIFASLNLFDEAKLMRSDPTAIKSLNPGEHEWHKKVLQMQHRYLCQQQVMQTQDLLQQQEEMALINDFDDSTAGQLIDDNDTTNSALEPIASAVTDVHLPFDNQMVGVSQLGPVMGSNDLTQLDGPLNHAVPDHEFVPEYMTNAYRPQALANMPTAMYLPAWEDTTDNMTRNEVTASPRADDVDMTMLESMHDDMEDGLEWIQAHNESPDEDASSTAVEVATSRPATEPVVRRDSGVSGLSKSPLV